MSDPLDLDEYDAAGLAGLPVEDSARVAEQHQSALDAASLDAPVGTQVDDLGVQDLGVDTAVSTARVRKPLPKLDADRLLNPHRGYPALLRSIGHLKYRKGAERKYLQKYVMTHQIWANRVWPKANFDDFIVIARKVGKDPRIRSYLRDLIESEKYGRPAERRERKGAEPVPEAGDAGDIGNSGDAGDSGDTGDASDAGDTGDAGNISGKLSDLPGDGPSPPADWELEAEQFRGPGDEAEHFRGPDDDELEAEQFRGPGDEAEHFRGPDDDELEAARELYGDIDF